MEIKENTEELRSEHRYPVMPKDQLPDVCAALRPFYSGVIAANDSFTPESGLAKIRSGNADMVSFGRLYIANPDLATRVINDHPVNSNWDVSTFYGEHHGDKGFVDYPAFKEQAETL